jgi:hypothetical protein
MGYGLKDRVVESSREKYSMDREVIEDKIKRWSNQKYSDKGNRSVMHRDKKDGKKDGRKKGEKKGS